MNQPFDTLSDAERLLAEAAQAPAQAAPAANAALRALLLEWGVTPRSESVVGLLEQAAWSERVAAPIERLAMIDEKVTFEAGATLGLAGLTALREVVQL